MAAPQFLVMMQVVMSIVLLLLLLFVALPMVQDAMEPVRPSSANTGPPRARVVWSVNMPDPVVLPPREPFRPPVAWMARFLSETPEQIAAKRLRATQLAEQKRLQAEEQRKKGEAARTEIAQRNKLRYAAVEQKLVYFFNRTVPIALFFVAYQIINNTNSQNVKLYSILGLFVVFLVMRVVLQQKYGQLLIDGTILLIALIVLGQTLQMWWFPQPKSKPKPTYTPPPRNDIEEPCERNESLAERYKDKPVYNGKGEKTGWIRTWGGSGYFFYHPKSIIQAESYTELREISKRSKNIPDVNLDNLTVCPPK